MFPRKVLPVGLAVLVVALPSAAVAAQLKAKDPPKVDGPLSTSPDLRRCTRRTERTESGRVIAHFKVCSRYYRFDPDKESDSNSNYGAFWIQVNADATNGWCARAVKVDLSYSGRRPKQGPEAWDQREGRAQGALYNQSDRRCGWTCGPKGEHQKLVRPAPGHITFEPSRQRQDLQTPVEGQQQREACVRLRSRAVVARGRRGAVDISAGAIAVRPRLLARFARSKSK
jgi:hypothetical protein